MLPSCPCSTPRQPQTDPPGNLPGLIGGLPDALLKGECPRAPGERRLSFAPNRYFCAAVRDSDPRGPDRASYRRVEQTVTVRRTVIVVGLIVALGGTAGCSTSPPRSSLPVCSGEIPIVTAKDGTGGTTATAPCATTTTTLPVAVPMGATVTLSFTSGVGASGRFTIHRIWMNATPQLETSGLAPGGMTFPQTVSQLLQASHLPPRQELRWAGVDLTITNTGQTPIGTGTAGGQGAPVLFFVVNGRGPTLNNETGGADLSESGFATGVPGCPFPPFTPAGTLNPTASISGCVALAVPVGVKVSTVGFDLEAAGGGPVPQVAQWTVSGQRP